MESKKRAVSLRLYVNILGAVVFLVLLTLYLTGNLGPNPIQKAHHLSGDIALIFLLISLSITPLRTLTGNNKIGQVRKTFGLLSFYFAALHLLIYIGLDYQFNFTFILNAFGFRKFMWVGLAAFLILSLLAFTSLRKIKVAVGKAWKKIHTSVYLAGILVVLHYTWSVKGNLFTLNGAVGKPFIASVVLVILLVLRLKPVKDWIIKMRTKAG